MTAIYIFNAETAYMCIQSNKSSFSEKQNLFFKRASHFGLCM